MYKLRFGSSGCPILTSYTSFESSWSSDFNYVSQFWIDSMTLRHVIIGLYSVKRTVEVKAVAL